MTELLYSPKIKPEHLARKAIVYLRQSSEKQVFKAEVTARIAEIEGQIKGLDSELSTMNELLAQAHIEVVNLAETWKKAGVNEKQELQLAVFPDGLLWSPDVHYFEPGNTTLMLALEELWTDLGENRW